MSTTASARAARASGDRFGIGWRPQLAAGILANLDRVDVVEVIAEDCAGLSSAAINGLRALGRTRPLLLHGVTLGPASTSPVGDQRLDALARAIDALQPESWSEHLAFVRAGGIEIGHLAAPPRTAATVEGTARNLARATRRAGAAPLVENVATLLEPPGSDRDETTWLREVIEASGCDLLLDLHNLHANATNFGFDPRAAVAALPPGRVKAIHIAGGRRVGAGGRRILDDHLHPVPQAVYDLLEVAGAHATGPLTVILERDGAYPPIGTLLDELDAARAALARGRQRA